MCFHTREEYEAYVANLRKAKTRAAKSMEHAKSDKKYAAIVLRCNEGKWVAGWYCDPTDPQDVANVIADLKSWHAGEYRYVDTSDVDAERAKLKLAPLDQDGLPIPDRLPRESVDKLVEQWDIENKSSLLPHQLASIKRNVARRRDEEAARKALEAEAARLGVPVEELVAR